MEMFNLFITIIIPLVAIGLFASLIYLIIKKGTADNSKIYFILLLMFGLLWIVAFNLEKFFSNYNFVIYLDFILAGFVAYFVVLFFSSLLPDKKNSLFYKICLFLPIIFTSYLSISKVFIVEAGKMISYDWFWYALYIGILIFYFLFIATFLLFKSIAKNYGIKKLQIKYIAIGYFFSIIPPLVSSIYDASMNINVSELKYFSILTVNAVVIFPIFTTYAITRYRLFGINFFLKKVLIYSVALLVISLVFTYLILFSQSFLTLALSANM